MRNTLIGSLAVVALLGVVSSVRAGKAVLADFDDGGTYYGGTEGFFNYSGLADFGVVNGPLGQSTNWIGFKPYQYWGSFIHQAWATPDLPASELKNYSQLEFDVMVDSGWIAGTNTVELGLLLGSTYHALPTAGIDLSQPGVPQHVVADLTSLAPDLATATYYEVQTNFRPGYRWEWDSNNPGVVEYNPHIYFDNFVFSTPAPVLVSGDLNGDGGFDGSDVDGFIEAVLEGGPFTNFIANNDAAFFATYGVHLNVDEMNLLGDFNADGGFDGSDIDGFVAAILGGRPVSNVAVPEPSYTAFLLGFGLVAGRRRRLRNV